MNSSQTKKPKIVTITVTQADIRWGGPYGDTCPVARATKRALGRKRIHVSHDLIYAVSTYGKVLAELPMVARGWIDDYDKHRSVEPLKFTVAITK